MKTFSYIPSSSLERADRRFAAIPPSPSDKYMTITESSALKAAVDSLLQYLHSKELCYSG